MMRMLTSWRFVLCTAILGLVVIIAAEFIHTVHDDAFTKHQNVQLFGLVQKQNSDYASDRAALLHDQRVLLANVQDLRSQQKAMQVYQQQLLAYMHRIGVRIPAELIVPGGSVSPRAVAPAAKPGKSTGHGKHK